MPWHLQKQHVNVARSAAEESTQDLRHSGESDPLLLQRYYHLFRKGELRELVEIAASTSSTPIHVIEDSWDHENWYVLVEKLKAG